jgi:hypothetical protein
MRMSGQQQPVVIDFNSNVPVCDRIYNYPGIISPASGMPSRMLAV